MENMLNISENIQIPDPAVNLEGEERISYTGFYRCGKTDDSSESSRHQLATKVKKALTQADQPPKIIHVGSGPQPVEKILQTDGKSTFVSVDIADFTPEQLQADYHKHTQANGASLPFSDEEFDIGISNMALDFMPAPAIDELHRVLKPGAPVYLNLHHPSLIPPDIDEQVLLQRKRMAKKAQYTEQTANDALDLASLRFHQYLKESNKLFKTPEQIKEAFGQKGFEVKRVDHNIDQKGDRWWEVDMIRK